VAETHLPLTLGILLDTSGSQQRVLSLEQDVGSQFLERVLEKKDEAFLLSFDVDVDLLQDYTNSARQLARAMSKAEINTAGGNGAAGIPGEGGGTIPTIGAPKGTVLYDAVYLAANQKMSQETGRKAMILLTDGEDEGSRVKINEAIAAAQKSNVIVYTILIADRGFLRGFWLQRLLGHEEDDRGDRRAADRRGQQRQEAGSRLSADRGRAAHPVCGQLYVQQHQAGRRLPQAQRRVPRRWHEGAGPQRLFRASAAETGRDTTMRVE
jgi:VWFA-related protein